jgi:RNA-directed DNA polymerase
VNSIEIKREDATTSILAEKLLDKGDDLAEAMEGRGVTRGSANGNPAGRTQSRDKRASTELEGVREVAKGNRKVRFTVLLRHVTQSLLVEISHALRKQAAAGVA